MTEQNSPQYLLTLVKKTIEQKDKTIAEQHRTIKGQDKTINEQHRTIKGQDKTIAEQYRTIKGQDKTINEQDKTIIELKAELERYKAELERYKVELERYKNHTNEVRNNWIRLTENNAHKYVGHRVRYKSRGVQKEHNILTVAESGKSIKIDNDGDLGTRLNVKRKIYVCISL